MNRGNCFRRLWIQLPDGTSCVANSHAPDFRLCLLCAKFAGVANITYPGVYDRFLRTFDLINLDLGFVLSAGCVLTDFDFHDRLLATTLGPLVALALLAATYSFARNKAKQQNREGIPTIDEVSFSSKIQASLRGVRSNSVVAAEGPLKRGDGVFERAPASGQDFSRRGHNAPAAMPTEAEDADNHALRRVKSKHFSAVLLLTFFVYSTVSSSLFQVNSNWFWLTLRQPHLRYYFL